MKLAILNTNENCWCILFFQQFMSAGKIEFKDLKKAGPDI